MHSTVIGLLATAMLASYTLAQDCPPAPANTRHTSRAFFSWCEETVKGRVVELRNGDLKCICDRRAVAPPTSVAPQVALWVGVPVATAAVFAGFQAMSEASQSTDELISGAQEEEGSKIGQAAATGAVVGLGVVAVGWTITKIAKSQAAPVGAPWWRRARLVTGLDRRGATRVGLAW